MSTKAINQGNQRIEKISHFRNSSLEERERSCGEPGDCSAELVRSSK